MLHRWDYKDKRSEHVIDASNKEIIYSWQVNLVLLSLKKNFKLKG